MIFEATINQDLVIKIPIHVNADQAKVIRDDFACLLYGCRGLYQRFGAHLSEDRAFSGDSLTLKPCGLPIGNVGLYRLGFEELGGPCGGIRAIWSTEDIVFKVNK
jgi:hypothetical protein